MSGHALAPAPLEKAVVGVATVPAELNRSGGLADRGRRPAVLLHLARGAPARRSIVERNDRV